jgi:hypothetical protein
LGLKADFDEVLSIWRSAPWRVRLWLALSLFLASGSIASLSEAVAKWKGFILTGVDFYRFIFVSPMISVISKYLSYRISTELADALILGSLFLSANLRLAFHNAGSTKGKAEAIGGTIMLVLIATAIAIWSSGPNTAKYLLALVMSFLVFSSLRFNNIGGATRLLWFTYILSPLLLVGLAASINAGLK